MPATANVTAATNATPIVVTTATPHGLVDSSVATLAGILGNTAANGTRPVKKVSATQFSLPATLSGNGVYTSGGTVTGPLGGITALVRQLSTELALKLAARGLPALHPSGEILLGSEHIFENESPNRIIFVPDTSDWGPGGAPQMGGVAAGGKTALHQSAERRAQITNRSRLTELLHFRIHVWGQATPSNPPSSVDREYDFDATRALYHALLIVMHETSVGTFTPTRGTWTGHTPRADGTQNVVAGRELVFGAAWRTPVLEDALDLVSGAPTPQYSMHLQPADPALPPESP